MQQIKNQKMWARLYQCISKTIQMSRNIKRGSYGMSPLSKSKWCKPLSVQNPASHSCLSSERKGILYVPRTRRFLQPRRLQPRRLQPRTGTSHNHLYKGCTWNKDQRTPHHKCVSFPPGWLCLQPSAGLPLPKAEGWYNPGERWKIQRLRRIVHKHAFSRANPCRVG